MTSAPRVYLADTAPGQCHRVRARDLAEAQRKSARIPAAARDQTTVLLEVEVLVGATMREAQHEWTRIQQAHGDVITDTNTIRYIGTVRGLSSLIDDVRAVGIADGAVLIPLAEHPTRDLLYSAFGHLRRR